MVPAIKAWLGDIRVVLAGSAEESQYSWLFLFLIQTAHYPALGFVSLS